MDNMNVKVSREATALIEALLLENPHPTNSDWKALVMNNPDYASEIVDFSILFERNVHLQSEAYDEPLDQDLFDELSEHIFDMLGTVESSASEAQAKLSKIVGPKSRVIARDIGLREHVEILDQIISGETKAPFVLVKRLASNLGLEIASLVQAFALNFSRRPAQAFKSDGKPKLEQEPIDWEVAVRAAELDQEDTNYLLGLERKIE
ncbi:hypothetical protein GTP41_20785 [Pseudoduganella sp. DS3]|uniref:Uncharacterized protein n=1 Tax=Pseudoduganella guangdongensis TaxID=2692179 RepID=A0A6N9HNZ4_9BURK|nr:hypothetical protein [Pseudoduganella guangdongensis]MYN04532.1 hypothetical protein [Pseudoduganella guangdongensis]